MKNLMVHKIEKESELAVGVTDTEGKVQWLPKSQIEIVYNTSKSACTIKVPEWLAAQKKYEYLIFLDD